MSLKQTILQGIETAFTAAGDLVSLGSYTVQNGTPVYNPATDTLTQTTVTISNVRMIRTAFTEAEREASPVTVTDVKVLIPGKDLLPHVPAETDTFTLDGHSYNLISYRAVPGNGLFTIFGKMK